LNNLIFWEIFVKPERSWGLPPPLGPPPNAITPEKVITALSVQRRGGTGGQALSPPSKHLSFLFWTMIKGILQSRKSLIFINTKKENVLFFK
jgi:hypothetical protein